MSLSDSRHDWCFDAPALGLTLAVRTHTRDLSRPGLPLLALHGWMDNAGTFNALLPELELDSDCHALDFSGHGLSSHRPAGSDYPIWGYVEEISALLEVLGLKRCRLMGHSMGGAVAALYAALYPERVASLILLDAGGPLSTSAAEVPDQMRESLAEKRRYADNSRTRRYPSRKAAEAARVRRGVSAGAARVLGERGIAEDSGEYFWTVDRQLQRPNPLSLTEEQVRAFLQRIAAPVLLVASRETLSAHPWFAEERLDCIRHLTMRVRDGGHFQHLEGQVEAVAADINGFLGEP